MIMPAIQPASAPMMMYPIQPTLVSVVERASISVAAMTFIDFSSRPPGVPGVLAELRESSHAGCSRSLIRRFPSNLTAFCAGQDAAAGECEIRDRIHLDVCVRRQSVALGE
jgi:hypothetical protein